MCSSRNRSRERKGEIEGGRKSVSANAASSGFTYIHSRMHTENPDGAAFAIKRLLIFFSLIFSILYIYDITFENDESSLWKP